MISEVTGDETENVANQVKLLKLGTIKM